MTTSAYVIIPEAMVATIRSDECVQWLVEQTIAGAQGCVVNGEYAIRFEEEADATAFRARWLK
jgi:hypothetical protein